MSIRIFLSHRPEDSGAVAQCLYDRVAKAFGPDNVLMKAESAGTTILDQLPVDVATQIAERVSECRALIAVIGPDWLHACDAAGVPRIGCRNDLVTVAIAAATACNIRVIPVLVDGAAMPPPDALPDGLLPLAWLEPVVLRDSKADADRLVDILHKLLGTGRRARSLRGLRIADLAAFTAGVLGKVAAPLRAVPRRMTVMLPAGALLVLVAAAATDQLASGGPPSEPDPWQIPAGFSAADFRLADRPPACDDGAPPQRVPINAGGAANLALLKQAKPFTSSLLPDGLRHQTTHLIDGWYGHCRSWIPAAMPAWVEVDLGEIFRLKGVRLGSEHGGLYGDRAPSAFSIAIRVDPASNWNVIYEQPASAGPLHQTREFIFPSPRPAQYVRVDITATRNGDLPRLDEFEIYGQRR